MKTTFKQINLLYLALLAGQVMFAVTVLYVGGIPKSLGKLSFDDPMLLFGIAVTFFSIIAAYGISEKRKTAGAQLSSFDEKIEHYRGLVIFRCALAEGANLMALVMALLSKQGFFFILFSAGLLAFLYFRPSTTEFSGHYNLRPEEERDLHARK